MQDDQITIGVTGDITERQELLNGSVTVTFEAASADGAWTLSGSLTWNRGLEAGGEEGDFALAGPSGELFATLVEATVVPADDADAAYRVTARYAADSGTGGFAGGGGQVVMEGALGAERLTAILSIST